MSNKEKELINDIIYEFWDNLRRGEYDVDKLSKYFGARIKKFVTWEDEYPYSINLLIEEEDEETTDKYFEQRKILTTGCLAKTLIELGYNIRISGDNFEIRTKSDCLLGKISMTDEGILDSYYYHFKELHKEEQNKLFELMSDYASTPIKMRGLIKNEN